MDYDLNTMPLDRNGRPIDPYEWNSFDGHSPYPMITTYFSDGNVDDSSDLIPHHWDLSVFASSTVATIILDTSTNERVAHWSETDRWTDPGVETRRSFLMHPDRRLKDNTTYIVAMRSLRTEAGALITPSEAFRALRDNIATSDPDVEYRRDDYNTFIFPALAAQGFTRSSLQLAWKFTTSSKESMIGRMQPMRDDALNNHMPAGGPAYSIISVEDDYNDNHFRKVVVAVEIPLYMTDAFPGARLVLDSNGNPVYQGTAPYRNTILIPRTAQTNPRPLRILQYGHGLFGGQGEVEGGYLGELANQYGYILVAGDWWGMSTLDVPALLVCMMTDFSDFGLMPDRIQQGLLNKIWTVRALLTSMKNDPIFNIGGVNIIEGTASYFGNSQGGILGVPLMAAHVDITRGVLGVPGGPYVVLLPRSADFVPYSIPIQLRYPDSLDQMTMINLLGAVWDRGEPGGYTSYISKDLMPNTPKHNVLWHYANSDSEVTWLGAYGCARSSDSYQFVNHITECNETVYGFPIATGSIFNENVIQGYDYQKPCAPRTNTPPASEDNTHGWPRREPSAWAQMDLFFRTGEVRDFCNGEGCYRSGPP